MSNFNSDGYIMIDLSDVDVTKSTQNVPGIYSRLLNVIDANKLILIVNHKGLTPQAAICNKLLNYYVITTNLYIYKINSNDIVIIEQSGSTSVEVSIIPTLMSGAKIADFAIGSIEGSLYAPEFESEINDNVTASNSTWSSDKIDGELALKADAADLAEVATTGNYDDLTNKPTIPTKTSDLTNDSGFITDADVPTIDDTTTSTTKVWSSDKTADELTLKADATAVYTKSQVDTALSSKADATAVYTKSQVDTALSSKADVTAVYTKSEVNAALAAKIDKDKLRYGVGMSFDSNGKCTIDISSWGLSSKPECVISSSNWAQSTIVSYNRADSTSTSLIFNCYDTNNKSPWTGTHPFSYIVLL